MQGKCTAWKSWPDGRPATSLIRMQKVVVSEEQFVVDLNRAEQCELNRAKQLVIDLSDAEFSELSKERRAGEIRG